MNCIRIEFYRQMPVKQRKWRCWRNMRVKQCISTVKAYVSAGAGVMLSTLAARIADQGLAGFEFAGGIPGTLGGAVTMNAGAYGGEIKDVIVAC